MGWDSILHELCKEVRAENKKVGVHHVDERNGGVDDLVVEPPLRHQALQVLSCDLDVAALIQETVLVV